ncbi:MAG: C-terminal binding protein [Thermomicrobia bacterium]|nr:C-terminal binding protein [Thermomicrobia bacterium]MCA1723096.1 C-terminal binding protein [Thermomicrobia bacterium]
MLSQPPDDRAVQIALDRWKKPGPGVLGIGNYTSGTSNPVQQALLAIGAETVATPLIGEDGAVDARLKTVDVLVSGGTVLNGPIYDQLSCRMILRPYVGYNDINVPEASERGILVCNVPDAYSEEVAMQALAFLMAANRQVYAFDKITRSGGWRSHMGDGRITVHNSKAQTVGVVGFGRIGRIFGQRAKALGFRVIATDPYVTQEEVADLGIPLLPMEQMLRESDYISIHAFLWGETHHLMNADRLEQMKPGAWIINTARGPIIEEAALVDALRAGHLAGAGMDVFEEEPIAEDNPLLTMENVMVSPHIAVYSEEGQIRASKRAAQIAKAALAGQLPDSIPAIDKGLYRALIAGGIPVAPITTIPVP